MTQVQELIDKIKKEGIEEADHRARQIEAETRKKADEIINKAKSQADQIIAAARAESQKLMDSARTAVQQSSRDTILNLRKEIEAVLRGIVLAEVQRSLTPEELSGIIRETVAAYLTQSGSGENVTITVSSKDLKKLKDGFIAELKEKLKTSVTLRSAGDIGGGFTISFDSGKSFFDFTDASLAEYLAGHLNNEVASLVKKAVSS